MEKEKKLFEKNDTLKEKIGIIFIFVSCLIGIVVISLLVFRIVFGTIIYFIDLNDQVKNISEIRNELGLDNMGCFSVNLNSNSGLTKCNRIIDRIENLESSLE